MEGTPTPVRRWASAEWAGGPSEFAPSTGRFGLGFLLPISRLRPALLLSVSDDEKVLQVPNPNSKARQNCPAQQYSGHDA
jgi:hypothetical protein